MMHLLSKQQRNAGLVFLALGVYVIFYALSNLKIGTIHAPGSGFFTLLCGCGILIFSLILVMSAFLRGTRNHPMWGKGHWRKPLLSAVVVIGYTFLITPLGFILGTILFLLCWQLVVERAKLCQVILVTVLGTGSMWFLFEKLLRVPLPNGLLPW